MLGAFPAEACGACGVNVELLPRAADVELLGSAEVVTFLVVVLVVVEVLFFVVVVTGGALVLETTAGTFDLVAFAVALATRVCILTGSFVTMRIGIGTRRLEV